METLWQWTQTPELHVQWDLRFSTIEYLPRPDPAEPQRFLYATRIGCGLRIEGTGESFGTVENVSGTRSSVLKFWSSDRKSLIPPKAPGSGVMCPQAMASDFSRATITSPVSARRAAFSTG